MAKASFIVSPCSLPQITDFTNWVPISINDYIRWQYKVRLGQCIFNTVSNTTPTHYASLSMPMPVGGAYETSGEGNLPQHCDYSDYCGSYAETKLACGGVKSCSVFVDSYAGDPNNPDLSGIVDSHNYTADEIKSLWSLSGWPDIFNFSCEPRFGVDSSGNVYFDLNASVPNGPFLVSTTPFDGAISGTATFLPFPPSEYFQTIYFSGVDSITLRVVRSAVWSYS
jgi:hypothetical protein